MMFFAESIQEQLLLFPNHLKHIEENHLGLMGDKSFFIKDPVSIIMKATLKSDAKFVSTKHKKRMLGMVQLEDYIGYDPRRRRWCNKLLLIIVSSKKTKKIITAYPVCRFQSLPGK